MRPQKLICCGKSMFCNVPAELLIHICTFMTADEISSFVDIYGIPDLVNLFSRKAFQHIMPVRRTKLISNATMQLSRVGLVNIIIQEDTDLYAKCNVTCSNIKSCTYLGNVHTLNLSGAQVTDIGASYIRFKFYKSS
jgi:hypothetical protein